MGKIWTWLMATDPSGFRLECKPSTIFPRSRTLENTAWVTISALSVTCCVTKGKSLNLSVHQFPIGKVQIMIASSSTLKRVNKWSWHKVISLSMMWGLGPPKAVNQTMELFMHQALGRRQTFTELKNAGPGLLRSNNVVPAPGKPISAFLCLDPVANMSGQTSLFQVVWKPLLENPDMWKKLTS